MTTYEKSKLEPLIPILSAELARYLAYLNHKENLAYLAVTLYIAMTATVLTAPRWPPASWLTTESWSFHLSAYLVLRLFLTYTLEKRRWAAIRLSGCSNTLNKIAKLLSDDAPINRIKLDTSPASRLTTNLMRLVATLFVSRFNYVRPFTNDQEAINTYYPEIFVQECSSLKQSSAQYHELIICAVCVGCLLAQLWSMLVL